MRKEPFLAPRDFLVRLWRGNTPLANHGKIVENQPVIGDKPGSVSARGAAKTISAREALHPCSVLLSHKVR
jgi:hypothetical protein